MNQIATLDSRPGRKVWLDRHPRFSRRLAIGVPELLMSPRCHGALCRSSSNTAPLGSSLGPKIFINNFNVLDWDSIVSFEIGRFLSKITLLETFSESYGQTSSHFLTFIL